MNKIYSKQLILTLLLLLVSSSAWAVGNEPFNIDPATGVLPSVPWNRYAPALMRTWMQQEIPAVLGRYFPTDWVNSGGSHSTSGTCVSSAFATEAFTSPTSPGGRSDHVQAKSDGSGGTAAIDYSLVSANCSNPGSAIARVAICSISGNTLGNWKRSSGSNYFVNVADASPAIPAGCAGLMDIVITNGAIASVVFIGNSAPVFTKVILSGPFLPSSTIAGLPTAGTAGRMRRLTNSAVPSALVIDNGADWTYVSSRRVNNLDFNFHAQAPGGSINIGATTITLTPCPFGVAGANVGHYLYVSGGVGTAEAVLITGGTCTSGATTGTIIFTAANTHSGAWTVTSATAGIQEADKHAVAPATVYVPNGQHVLYAPVVLAAGNSLIGQSRNGTYLYQSFTTGHAITISALSLAGVEVSHVFFVALVTVNANYFYINAITSEVHIFDVSFELGWGDILLDNVARGWVDHIALYDFARGIQVGGPTGASGIVASNIIASTAIVNSVAFYLRRGLIDLSNFNIQYGGVDAGGGSQITIAPQNGELFTESTITNGTIDGGSFASIYFNPAGGASDFTFVLSNLLLTGGAHPDHYGIVTHPSLIGIQFSNIRIVGVGSSTHPAILLIGGTSVSLNQVNIEDFTTGGVSAIQFNAGGVTTNALSITNSRMGYTSLGAQDPNCAYALNGSSLNNTDVTLVGNTLFGATVIFVNAPTVFTRWNVGNNLGLKNLGATVAAAGTTAFPFMDDGEILTLTGNTAVTAVSQLRAGQHGTLIATDVAPGAWSAGATIGNTFTPVQNVPLQWVFDGTKIYGK